MPGLLAIGCSARICARVVDVEAPEVDQLAGGVDLGLERGLRLAEHGGGVEPLPPRAGQQVGRLEDDRAALVERHRAPGRGGVEGGLHGGLGVLGGGVLERREDVLVVVGLDDLHLRAATVAPTAVDDRAQRRLAALLALELGDQGVPLGAARRVGQVGLVDGSRRRREGIHGADPSPAEAPHGAGRGSPAIANHARSSSGSASAGRSATSQWTATQRAQRSATLGRRVVGLGDHHDPAAVRPARARPRARPRSSARRTRCPRRRRARAPARRRRARRRRRATSASRVRVAGT